MVTEGPFVTIQKVGTDADSGCRRPSVTIEIPLFTGDGRSSVTIEYFGWLRMLTFRNHPKLGHVVGYEWLRKVLPSPSVKWLQKFFRHHFISHGAKFWMVTERTFRTHRKWLQKFFRDHPPGTRFGKTDFLQISHSFSQIKLLLQCLHTFSLNITYFLVEFKACK